MAFVPPLFTQFGKTSEDLLTQKWNAKKDELKNQVSVMSSSKCVSVTSTAYGEGAGKQPLSELSGKVVVKFADKSFGETTVEYSTTGALKATSKFSKLYKGLVVKTEAEYKNAATGKTSVEYSQESVATQIEYNQAKNSVLASLAVGLEGFSAGVSANVDLKKAFPADKTAPAVSPFLINGGFQYEDGNMIGTLTLENHADIGVSLYHRVSEALQLGSKYIFKTKEGSSEAGHSIAAGAQYKVDKATLVKGKIDISSQKNYVLSGWLQHKLANPQLTFALASQHFSNGANPIFALNVVLGEN